MAELLVLTSRVCYPPREGHQLRTWHLLRELAREHRITLLSFSRADDALEDLGPLRDLFFRFETFPIPTEQSSLTLLLCLARGLFGRRPFVVEKYTSGSFNARVAELSTAADLIHVDMLPLMSTLGAVSTSIPLVLNAHNVEYALLRQRAAVEVNGLKRAYLRLQVGKLKRYEKQACRRADQILACSRVDAEQLVRMAPSTAVGIIPNGVDTLLNHPDASRAQAASDMVFVGQMGWFPNLDGVRWFLAEILPLIVAQRADARFVLVGKPTGLSIPAALARHVHLAGFVDDVRISVKRAAVYIVPLRAGSGTRLKVLEAMALGMPIVTTSMGAEGIALNSEKSALFADTAAGFAAAVLRILDDPGLADRLASAARDVAVRTYDWQLIGNDLRKLYAKLLRD